MMITEISLCVLDFDEFPGRDEVIKNFKYKDTYCRSSPHGYHLFYWSPVGRESMCKTRISLKWILKWCTAANPNSLGGYVRYYPRRCPSNDLPVMEIDINKLIQKNYMNLRCTIGRTIK